MFQLAKRNEIVGLSRVFFPELSFNIIELESS